MKKGAAGQGYAVLRGTGARIDVYLAAHLVRGGVPVTEGSVVLVQGRLGLWQPGGRFQINATSTLLSTDMVGERARARCRVERDLRADGVFDRDRRALPAWPATVAVVTSVRGAALHDVRAAVRRRAPWVTVHVHDCVVQGPTAASSIIAALDTADRSSADIVILTRGGGEPGALDPFDDASVVRRVAASGLPIVVAVGHDSDRTLAELAADRAASTPSAAAEIAVPDVQALKRELTSHRQRLHLAARNACTVWRRRATESRARAVRETHRSIAAWRERIERFGRATRVASMARFAQTARTRAHESRKAIRRGASVSVREARSRANRFRPGLLLTHGEVAIRADRCRLEETRRAIESLSPERVLARGYALVLNAEGRPIRSTEEARAPQHLTIRLHDGEVAVLVVPSESQRPTLRSRE
jgi:exodeoxyribonuclease VII large subunit